MRVNAIGKNHNAKNLAFRASSDVQVENAVKTTNRPAKSNAIFFTVVALSAGIITWLAHQRKKSNTEKNLTPDKTEAHRQEIEKLEMQINTSANTAAPDVQNKNYNMKNFSAFA